MNDIVEQYQEESGRHSLVWSAAALLLFFLLAVAGHNYRENLRSTVIASAPLDADCSLNAGSCRATLANGSSATFTLGPHPIVAVSPLQMSLQLDGVEAEEVVVNFQGESMNMGINRFRMSRASADRFNGKATLPVCVRNSMVWIATIEVVTEDGILSFPFRFTSLHP